MSESDSTRTEVTKKWLPNLKHPSFIGRPASIWLDLGKNQSSAGKIMCNICQTSSETMKAALAHLRSKHKNQKQYECDQCSERFNVFENLQTHKASHETKLSSEGIVKCPIKDCGKEFRRMVVFRHHVQKEHQINDDFHCKTCNFPFPTVFELEQHRLAHVSREKRRLERRKRELKQKLENPPVPDEISNSKQNIPEPPVFPETREITSIQDELPETPILDPPVQEVMELVREKTKNKRGSVANSSKKLSTFEDFTFQKPQPLNDALTALDEIVGTISDPVVNAARNQGRVQNLILLEKIFFKDNILYF